jgi:hypothetical protein
MSHVAFDGEPVQAELFLDCEFFRAAAFEKVENFAELIFSAFVFIGDDVEEGVVEGMISEDDGGDRAENVIVVADESVAALPRLSKCWQVVVVHHCVSEQFQKLLHALDYVVQLP